MALRLLLEERPTEDRFLLLIEGIWDIWFLSPKNDISKRWFLRKYSWVLKLAGGLVCFSKRFTYSSKRQKRTYNCKFSKINA